MRSFKDLNPFTITAYFVFSILIPVVSMDPIILATALVAAVLNVIISGQKSQARLHLLCLLTILISTVINALSVHRGETVIVVINDAPITSEALFYGFCTGIMISASLYLFSSFSEIMTSDKLLYVFSFLSPAASMVLSMAFRFVPRFMQKSKEINTGMLTLGKKNSSNFLQLLKTESSVFSALVTWGLENGIVTAESMECRGYGLKRRTSCKKFSFAFADFAVLIIETLCFGTCLVLLLSKKMDISFYPAFSFFGEPQYRAVAYTSYALLALVPVIINIEEDIKWRYLLRKI